MNTLSQVVDRLAEESAVATLASITHLPFGVVLAYVEKRGTSAEILISMCIERNLTLLVARTIMFNEPIYF